MRKNFFILAAVFCLISLTKYAVAAPTGVVTFDDVFANSIINTYNTNGQSFSDMGLTFTNNGTFSAVWNNSTPHSNGTNSFIFSGFKTGDKVAITAQGGGPFNVLSMDMSISWYDINATEVVDVNGSPITLVQGIQTYNLNLNGINELDITGVPSNSGYWLLDNINLGRGTGETVPEPATMLLFGTGLAGLVALRRKKTA